jgi:hypothetical protein
MANETKVDAVPDYKRAKLGSRFRAAVKVRQEIKETISKLETKLGTAENPGINQEIELALAEKDLRVVRCEDWTVTLCEGSNTSLSKEKLLEAGVPVEVLEAATVTRKYTYIQVKDTKRAQEGADKARAAGVDVPAKRRVTLKKSTKARVMRKMEKAESGKKAVARR